MNFKDPGERDNVLGPLFANEAKAGIPIFGPEKFASKSTRARLDAIVKRLLQSPQEHVINLLAATEASSGQKLNTPRLDSLNGKLGQLNIEPESARMQSEDTNLVSPKKALSSRKLHHTSHYTSSSTNSNSEILGHVMLQRAMGGYLFNCKQNMAVVDDDAWLQDVWEWIEGKLDTL
jgi:hypothetical protein